MSAGRWPGILDTNVTNSRWVLSGGIELPEPDVPIYISESIAEVTSRPPSNLRGERAPSDIAQNALDTYQRAGDNALSLLEDARILSSAGRHSRAFALAATALEEIGKSQYAADVYTGFIPHEGFEKNIRDHRLKTGYANRVVQFDTIIEPFLRDKETAESLFERRNDSLYASSSNLPDDAAYQDDAETMIDYCETWLERIRNQEEIAERIGTKAFLK